MDYLVKCLFRVLPVVCIATTSFIFLNQCSAQARKVRIACIGNSITAGARVSNPGKESYPALLDSMLQAKGYINYSTRNFGVGGATVIKFGQPNLWPLLDSLKLYLPDIVIIKVGTNETVSEPRYNWEHIGEFERDYLEYIKAVKGINPQCKFILCSPLDMVIQTERLSAERIANLTERRPRVWQLRDRIKKLAEDQGAYFLDLTNPFIDRPDLMTSTDGVHPNKEGYRYLASLVFAFMESNGLVLHE